MRPCEVCGKDTVTYASEMASKALVTLGEGPCAWLRQNYQLEQTPTNLCAECFLPAYNGALQVYWMAQQV